MFDLLNVTSILQAFCFVWMLYDRTIHLEVVRNIILLNYFCCTNRSALGLYLLLK